MKRTSAAYALTINFLSRLTYIKRAHRFCHYCLSFSHTFLWPHLSYICGVIAGFSTGEMPVSPDGISHEHCVLICIFCLRFYRLRTQSKIRIPNRGIALRQALLRTAYIYYSPAFGTAQPKASALRRTANTFVYVFLQFSVSFHPILILPYSALWHADGFPDYPAHMIRRNIITVSNWKRWVSARMICKQTFISLALFLRIKPRTVRTTHSAVISRNILRTR